MALDLDGFEITRAPAGPSRMRAGRSGQSRLNKGTAAALVAMLFLFPIPLAANRPIFWAINAMAIGALALVYAIAMMRMEERFRFPLLRVPALTILWTALCLYMVVQLLPVGAFGAETRWGDIFTTSQISIAPGMTILALVQFATFGVFFFLMLQVTSNRSRAIPVAEALFAIVVAFAVYGVLALTQFGDTLLFFEKWAYHGSATATFVNRNSYATFLAFGLVIGAALSIRKLAEGRSPRGSTLILYGLGMAVIVSALLLSQSRMGLAAGLTGSVFVLAAGGVKMSRERPALGLAVICLGAVAVAGLAMLFGSGTLERLGSTEHDLDVRRALYEQVAVLIGQRPWLGFGAGSFELAFPLVRDLPVSPDRVWDKAHSTYLSLWVELGLIAGSIPLLAIGWIGLKCARLFVLRKTDWTLPLAALGAIVVAALHSLVDFSLEMQANAFFLVAILAIGLAGESNFVPRSGHK
ncbi:O-antigen ligase family protein [Pelagibacterium limicola]|uniref:O-antigen ligase family protein n=1 Tax=Pelagibacterium limicola TaxID=2791022 RepID=UPI0018AF781C|nr:O-antigen ligase family protein [Pelagibacterium limicola]